MILTNNKSQPPKLRQWYLNMDEVLLDTQCVSWVFQLGCSEDEVHPIFPVLEGPHIKPA